MILIVIALLSCEIEQWPDRRQDGEESPVRRAGGGRRAAVLFWSLARTLLSACLHCPQQHTSHSGRDNVGPPTYFPPSDHLLNDQTNNRPELSHKDSDFPVSAGAGADIVRTTDFPPKERQQAGQAVRW